MRFLRGLCVSLLFVAAASAGTPAKAGCRVSEWNFAADFVNSEKVLRTNEVEDICGRKAWSLFAGGVAGPHVRDGFIPITEIYGKLSDRIGWYFAWSGDLKGFTGIRSPAGDGFLAVNTGADLAFMDANGAFRGYIRYQPEEFTWPAGTVLFTKAHNGFYPVITWSSSMKGDVRVEYTLTIREQIANVGVVGHFEQNGDSNKYVAPSVMIPVSPFTGNASTFSQVLSVDPNDVLYFSIPHTGDHYIGIDIVITPL